MPFSNQPRGPRGRFFFFPLVGAALALVLGGVVMSLWNAILPAAVHAGRLSYWQGVGLLVLCRILFGSFGPRAGWGARRQGWGRGREKWMQMSDEERRRFRSQWWERHQHRRGGRPRQD
ncbi:hypothetical protein [Hymenobacter sp. GOD-10R]|uniref:hypothetical protein n=1 Tax=Hymenobacter sp. GOD-10R TaxID=3093922 RepID=UPI002D78D1CB|nr:hypothetical protein [Hymenobacter sp. GOD-10R]WRQ29015.1 hypothetical protein SD425_01900 [Hymenobacter sp. GOD-10R]